MSNPERTEDVMGDVIFLAVVVAFFALTIAYVRGCEKIVGPDTGVVAAGSDASTIGRDGTTAGPRDVSAGATGDGTP